MRFEDLFDQQTISPKVALYVAYLRFYSLLALCILCCFFELLLYYFLIFAFVLITKGQPHVLNR